MVMSANNPPRTAKARELKVFARHQIRIAKETLRMPDQVAAALGGMTKDQARAILHEHGVRFKDNSPKLDKQRTTRDRAERIRRARNPKARVEIYQLISSITGKPIRKATKVVFSDGREVKFIERLPKRKAIRAAMDQLGVSPAQNPVSELMVMGANPRVEVVSSPNPPTEEIVEEFTGREVEYLDVYNEPHMPRGRYAKLGPLIALYIKLAKGGQVQRIGASEAVGHDFPKAWGGKPPLVVCDSSAKQIYFVDGSQDITNCLEAFGALPRQGAPEIVELGAARRIDYQCRKEHVASPDEDLWKHDHGEENGVLPTVLFDTKNKRLLYEGGDYRIEGPWIRN
jgi:hypothetical protein